jgi:transposase
MTPDAEILPDDIDALRAALAAERAARLAAEARATGAEAMIAHLKLLIAKLQRDRFGPTSERSRRLLDQLELQLEELEANAAEAALLHGPGVRAQLPQPRLWFRRCGRRSGVPAPAYG